MHLDAVAVEVVGAQLNGARAGSNSDRTALRCGGIWRAKLSRFCTICLVRCASCRMTRRSLRAVSGEDPGLHEQVGESQDRGQRIVHLVRDAGDQLSNRRHLLGVNQLVAQHRRSR